MTSRGTLRQANKRFSEPKEVSFRFSQDDTASSPNPSLEAESQVGAGELETSLMPSSQRPDAYLARRGVGNLTAVVAGMVQSRAELTMSGLGSAITDPAHAEAGMQRLQRA
jgi:hypothetical protein